MSSILDICRTTDLPVRSFESGEEILIEGTKDGFLYFLKEGAVEVCKSDVTVNTISSHGSILGEVSVLLDRPHMATVKAIKPTTVYLVEHPEQFLRDHPEVNLQIARLLASRLQGVTAYLVDLKQQFEAREDHPGVVDEVLQTLLQHHVNKEI